MIHGHNSPLISYLFTDIDLHQDAKIFFDCHVADGKNRGHSWVWKLVQVSAILHKPTNSDFFFRYGKMPVGLGGREEI